MCEWNYNIAACGLFCCTFGRADRNGFDVVEYGCADVFKPRDDMKFRKRVSNDHRQHWGNILPSSTYLTFSVSVYLRSIEIRIESYKNFNGQHAPTVATASYVNRIVKKTDSWTIPFTLSLVSSSLLCRSINRNQYGERSRREKKNVGNTANFGRKFVEWRQKVIRTNLWLGATLWRNKIPTQNDTDRRKTQIK